MQSVLLTTSFSQSNDATDYTYESLQFDAPERQTMRLDEMPQSYQTVYTSIPFDFDSAHMFFANPRLLREAKGEVIETRIPGFQPAMSLTGSKLLRTVSNKHITLYDGAGAYKNTLPCKVCCASGCNKKCAMYWCCGCCCWCQLCAVACCPLKPTFSWKIVEDRKTGKTRTQTSNTGWQRVKLILEMLEKDTENIITFDIATKIMDSSSDTYNVWNTRWQTSFGSISKTLGIDSDSSSTASSSTLVLVVNNVKDSNSVKGEITAS
eukprot:TRINITY_DN4676_c0_g1_i1.p1 TRINITY_DN4676_c0_g1~~TRINITY_DN4676_c0_g1_i1.p1  ORF type:complete len:265 (+),score=27.52 TRINITY_DN4676_c0_g1_i1:64-858(+)